MFYLQYYTSEDHFFTTVFIYLFNIWLNSLNLSRSLGFKPSITELSSSLASNLSIPIIAPQSTLFHHVTPLFHHSRLTNLLSSLPRKRSTPPWWWWWFKQERGSQQTLARTSRARTKNSCPTSRTRPLTRLRCANEYRSGSEREFNRFQLSLSLSLKPRRTKQTLIVCFFFFCFVFFHHSLASSLLLSTHHRPSWRQVEILTFAPFASKTHRASLNRTVALPLDFHLSSYPSSPPSIPLSLHSHSHTHPNLS